MRSSSGAEARLQLRSSVIKKAYFYYFFLDTAGPSNSARGAIFSPKPFSKDVEPEVDCPFPVETFSSLVLSKTPRWLLAVHSNHCLG